MADDRQGPSGAGADRGRGPLRRRWPVIGRGGAGIVGLSRHPAVAFALGLHARPAAAASGTPRPAATHRRSPTTPESRIAAARCPLPRRRRAVEQPREPCAARAPHPPREGRGRCRSSPAVRQLLGRGRSQRADRLLHPPGRPVRRPLPDVARAHREHGAATGEGDRRCDDPPQRARDPPEPSRPAGRRRRPVRRQSPRGDDAVALPGARRGPAVRPGARPVPSGSSPSSPRGPSTSTARRRRPTATACPGWSSARCATSRGDRTRESGSSTGGHWRRSWSNPGGERSAPTPAAMTSPCRRRSIVSAGRAPRSSCYGATPTRG